MLYGVYRSEKKQQVMVWILPRSIILPFFSIGDIDQDGWPEHDYESGLSGALKGLWEDGEDMYKSNFK